MPKMTKFSIFTNISKETPILKEKAIGLKHKAKETDFFV